MREYAIAAAIFAVALLARLALDHVLPGRLPYITFFSAIVLAAYLCGRWASIVVLVLSFAAGTFSMS